MEKEYALLHATLELSQKSSQRSSHALSLPRTMSPPRRAEELVSLLADAGLFDVAIDLCRQFDIKMDVVFEHLTLRCHVSALPLVLTASCFHENNSFDVCIGLSRGGRG